MQTVDRSRTNVIGWLTLIVCLAGFFLWQVNRIHIFEFSNDEGTILMWTRMARAGYPLYTSTVTDQPPGLTVLLTAAFSLFGESVTVARILSLGLGTLGLLAVALIAWELGGWGAATASVFLLGISPRFSWYSRAIMQDVPALSLAAIALALVLIYGRSRMRAWLWLSGLAFGLSLMVKLITLPLLAPIGLTLLAANATGRRIEVRPTLLDGLVWATGAALPAALVLVAFDTSAMIPQVVGSVAGARGAYSWDLTENLARFRDLVLEGNVGLVALAAVGLLYAVRQPKVSLWVVVTWLGIATLALLAHVPLWSHHLIMVLMPVAALAGVGVSSLARISWARRSEHQAGARLIWVLAGLLVLVAYLASIPTILRINSEEISRFEPIKWEALARLREFTEPGDFAVSDMGMMLFRAGLLSPPTTADFGARRFEAGLLTDRDVLEATFSYPVKAVVFWTSRQRLVPDYVAWVDHNYQHVFEDGRSRHIYVPYEGGPVIHCPQFSRLDDGVTFVGYTLAKSTVQVGEPIHLTLFWEAREPVKGDYTVFTHLIDDTDKLWGQKDNRPGAGSRPTNSWQPGVLIVDNYTILVDPETLPGSYQLEVGMYEPASGQRLMVLDAEGRPRDHRILLGPVTVQ